MSATIGDREYVYVFDNIDQKTLESVRSLLQQNKLLPATNSTTSLPDGKVYVPLRFAPNVMVPWRSLLQNESWTCVLHKCGVTGRVLCLPNSYVDGFNGPTKVSRLEYNGKQVLLLADYHGSENNMCDRPSSGARKRGSAAGKRPRVENWIQTFVDRSNDTMAPVVDVVLEAMDAELETNAPFPLDSAVQYFQPCLENKGRQSHCGKHRFHKIDIRHGSRFPYVAQFEVVIDSFYGKSGSSKSDNDSVRIWQEIYNEIVPLYTAGLHKSDRYHIAANIMQKVFQREPNLLAEWNMIQDQNEKQRVFSWIATKIATMPTQFLNIQQSIRPVLQLYQNSSSRGEFARRSAALRQTPQSSLMHAALFFSVLLVDFYALCRMLRSYSSAVPTHIVIYAGFHHFDNYVDFFGVEAETVGRSGSDQRCETCSMLSQPFLVPKHTHNEVSIYVPLEIARSLVTVQSTPRAASVVPQQQPFARRAQMVRSFAARLPSSPTRHHRRRSKQSRGSRSSTSRRRQSKSRTSRHRSKEVEREDSDEDPTSVSHLLRKAYPDLYDRRGARR